MATNQLTVTTPVVTPQISQSKGLWGTAARVHLEIPHSIWRVVMGRSSQSRLFSKQAPTRMLGNGLLFFLFPSLSRPQIHYLVVRVTLGRPRCYLAGTRSCDNLLNRTGSRVY
jgi:hypothetical protein